MPTSFELKTFAGAAETAAVAAARTERTAANLVEANMTMLGMEGWVVKGTDGSASDGRDSGTRRDGEGTLSLRTD